MDIGNMLNTKNAAAAAAAEAQLQQQFAHAGHLRGPSNMASDHPSNTHHGDPHLYTPNGHQPLHPLNNLPPPSQTPHTMPMMSNGYLPIKQENAYSSHEASDDKSPEDTSPKAFMCSTCSKGFARRSDLARHERIHTGHRPHVCEYDGCKKRFIQRSALTVHHRTHTGEKPHTCDTCGTKFADSSSLARHRRIHTGLRPFKCPYAFCQKTFTRRTTLTRHQNHHAGGLGDANAETNAKLGHLNVDKPRRHSEGNQSEENGSTGSSPSPSQRPLSISPGHELPPIPNMHRSVSDYSYMANGSLPPHLRQDFQQQSPRSSPGLGSPSISNYGTTSTSHSRPSMTSHPNPYGPPQPLEPPANNDHRSTGSVTGSPHMSTVGWGSPQNHGIPSPGPMDSYGYPDSTYGSNHPLYFSGSHIRRPQSTEPDNYEMKPMRHLDHTQWTSMPVMQ